LSRPGLLLNPETHALSSISRLAGSEVRLEAAVEQRIFSARDQGNLMAVLVAVKRISSVAAGLEGEVICRRRTTMSRHPPGKYLFLEPSPAA
jgi:hypothetical protein